MDKLEDMIDEASKFPLSNKIIIEKDSLFDVISEIKLKLPDEINKANWVAKERQRILAEAEMEAEEIKDVAKRQQESLINETEIIRLSSQKADEIIYMAEKKAQEMKTNAVVYCDALLENLQNNFYKIQAMIEKNREDLRNV